MKNLKSSKQSNSQAVCLLWLSWSRLQARLNAFCPFLGIPTGSNFHGRHHAKFVCFARHFYQLTSDTYPNGRRHPRGNAYSTHLVTPSSSPLLLTTVRSVPHPTQLGACAGAELHLHNYDSNFNFNFQLSFCFNFSLVAWEFFLLVFIVFICAGGC